MVCVGDPAEVEHPFYLAYYTLQYVLTTDLGSEADLPFDHSLNKPRDGVDLIEASLGHFPIASHRTSERHGVIDGIIIAAISRLRPLNSFIAVLPDLGQLATGRSRGSTTLLRNPIGTRQRAGQQPRRTIRPADSLHVRAADEPEIEYLG